MALDNLRAFIGAIDAAGDLRRVDRPVSVALEITEVADRVMKSPPLSGSVVQGAPAGPAPAPQPPPGTDSAATDAGS